MLKKVVRLFTRSNNSNVINEMALADLTEPPRRNREEKVITSSQLLGDLSLAQKFLYNFNIEENITKVLLSKRELGIEFIVLDNRSIVKEFFQGGKSLNGYITRKIIEMCDVVYYTNGVYELTLPDEDVSILIQSDLINRKNVDLIICDAFESDTMNEINI